jgi:hypothetical protein
VEIARTDGIFEIARTLLGPVLLALAIRAFERSGKMLAEWVVGIIRSIRVGLRARTWD